MKYTNLVLSGGGCRGLYYLGMMKYFEEKKQVDNFKNVVGTSIGAFFATAIAIGYKSDELREYSLNVIDYERLKGIDLFGFLENMGIDKGRKFEHNIKLMVRNKVGKKDITFQQVYETYGKNLILIAICLENRDVVYLSKDTYPHMKLWKAIRMSMSVPFLFKPYEYRGNHYIDGGLKMNFAVHLFNSADTLGIDIVQNGEKPTMKTFIDYMSVLVETLIANNGVKQEQDIIKLDGSFNPDRPLLSFHLEIDDGIINEAIEYSVKSIEAFFEKRDKEIESICQSVVNSVIEECITGI
jgi:predicted acylesterase/phospholipase RssA